MAVLQHQVAHLEQRLADEAAAHQAELTRHQRQYQQCLLRLATAQDQLTQRSVPGQ